MSKYKTKQARLLAITDAWKAIHGAIPFTVDEVSEWACENGLYPVPRRPCREVDALVWEEMLQDVLSRKPRQKSQPMYLQRQHGPTP